MVVAVAKKVKISPLEANIIREVEYYFGDVYLIKFMKEDLTENDGWVTVDTMLKFKRLSALSEDKEEIMAALEKSDSGLLEISEADMKVRRSENHPLPDNSKEAKAELEGRTCLAEGFDKENTTLEDLLLYYNENHPSVINISMRQYFLQKNKKSQTQEKKFKGSVFLTFKTKKDCDKFVKKKKHQMYNETQLEKVMHLKDYHELSKKELEEKKAKQKEEMIKKSAQVKTEKPAFAKGAVIKITGLGGEITREDLKDMLQKKFKVKYNKKDRGDIAFITYEKGQAEALIRFKTENYGKDLVEKMNKVEKLSVKDMEVKVTLLEGDEETAFLEENLSLKIKNNEKRNNKNKKRKSSGEGKGGGRGGKRQKTKAATTTTTEN